MGVAADARQDIFLDVSAAYLGFPQDNADLYRLMYDERMLAMRIRLAGLRRDLAEAGLPGSDRIGEQDGLFAMLNFSPAEIEALRLSHAMYIDASGRINIAGLNGSNFGRFLASCRAVSGR